MSKEINTVTISLKEYDKLRKLKLEYNKNKFVIRKEFIELLYGRYEEYYASTNNEIIKDIIGKTNKLIERYQDKISRLENDLRDKEPIKTKKKWYQL